MNTTEKRIIVPVLFLAFGLFFLGFTATGFVLAMCVAIFLGSTTGTRREYAPAEFPVPHGNWSVVYKVRRVPVMYSSLASDNVMRFMAGHALEIVLLQESAQPDRKIAVYGHWTDASGCSQRIKLGRIPCPYAADLFSEIDNRPGCFIAGRIASGFLPAQYKCFSGLALDIAVLEPSLGAYARASSPVQPLPITEYTIPGKAPGSASDPYMRARVTGTW